MLTLHAGPGSRCAPPLMLFRAEFEVAVKRSGGEARRWHSTIRYRLQRMRVNVDVAAWPTKQEAAAQLEVSGRRIEQLLKQSLLRKRIRRNAGLSVVVIDPESIAECRQVPCDLSAEGTPNSTASVALSPFVEPNRLVQARSGNATSGLEAAFLAFLQSKTPSSLVPVERRLFLTMAESAEYSGLPVVLLRRLVASGKLKALRTGAGWRVSRVELERSSQSLTDTPEDLSEHELRDLEVNRRRRQGNASGPDNVPDE